jgi:ATP-dependent RNA helicase DeaD
MQITSDLSNFSKFMPGVKIVPVYGGTGIITQIREVKNRPSVVVGTPGRVLDLIRRKVLDLTGIRWLILDEADEMLNMGFQEDLNDILSQTPKERQTLLFSATMPRAISSIASQYMNSPEEISVGKKNAGAENVNHEYFMVHARDRYPALKRIVDVNPSIYGIIFCRTRQETHEVAEKLMHDGYNDDALHGDLSQVQRDYVMNRFRIRNLQLLVATDVAARGLDVQDLTHIINYNLPDDPEVYVHRSGRTGRAGKTGIAVSLIHTREQQRIWDLERMTRKTFVRKPVPGGREICEKQLFNLVDRVENTQVDNENIEQFLPVIFKKLEWLGRDELIKHFISVEFNRFLEYYKDAPDLNVAKPEKRKEDDRRSVSYAKLHISLGSRNNLTASALISWVNRHSKGKRVLFGKIDIQRSFSYFEVEAEQAEDMIRDLNNRQFDGFPVTVESSRPETRSNHPRSETRNNYQRAENRGKYQRPHDSFPRNNGKKKKKK